MVNVVIVTESRFPINRDSIKKTVENILLEKKVHTQTEVEINIVGDRKMRNLNKTHRNLDHTTNVLSFPLEESVILEKSTHGFVSPPDKVLRLGNIVVSYPQAVMEAGLENKMVDDHIDFLVEHGMLHLLGFHHEE
jgi:probable rRNA maturation factor